MTSATGLPRTLAGHAAGFMFVVYVVFFMFPIGAAKTVVKSLRGRK